MGTRALTVFHSIEDESEIAVLYRQMDGYPSGHGKALLAALASSGDKVSNGISGQAFNGPSDLAVRVISLLKGDATQPGQFYLHPARTRDCGEEYVYHVMAQLGHPIRVRVDTGAWEGHEAETLFDGDLKAFKKFCNRKDA